MKNCKNIIAALLMMLLLLTSLVSCKLGDGDGDGSGDGGGTSGDTQGGSTDTGDGSSGGTAGNTTDFAYLGAEIFVVAKTENLCKIAKDTLGERIYELTGAELKSRAITDAKNAREIIIGESDRDISAKAYRSLARLALDSKEYAAYAIYSDGTSIAIAYTDEEVIEFALNDFKARFLDTAESTVTLGVGRLRRDSFSLYGYYEEIDRQTRERQFATLREKLDTPNIEDIIASLEQLYSLYTDDMVSWFANLYDPEVGGFYYSNSGRDTEGFLPDVESTMQAIGFLQSSGVISKADLPEWMKAQMVSFVQSLQDPRDGYFYHPQWKETGVNDARRGRDLNWSEQLLEEFGAEPLYPTANDRLRGEEYISPEPAPVSLSAPLSKNNSASAAILASKVVAAALPSHLSSAEALWSYLESFDWSPGNSYENGNHISAQASQIKAAGLINVALDFFDSIINPDTGFWSDKLNNEAVNGYLKIGSMYNNAKRAVPYAKKAAVGMLTNNLRMFAGDPTGGDREYYASTPCHLYNPWAALSNLLINLGNAGEYELRNEIRAMIKEQAPEQIAKTAEYAKEFLKDDGSFSWQYNSNSSGSQGATVAVAGINEGDVNSTCLSSSSVRYYIFYTMGVGEYTVDMFGMADKLRFLHTLEDLGAIVKTGAASLGMQTFDSATAADSLSESWQVELDTPVDSLEKAEKGWGYAYVTDEGALAFGRTFPGQNCYVANIPAGKTANTRYIMEFALRYNDVEIVKTNNRRVLRLSMYANGGRFYTLDFILKDNGNLALSENQTAELVRGEWNKIRVEYYKNTFLNFCKVYINGEYIGEYGTADEAYSDTSWTKGMFELPDSVKSAYFEIDDLYLNRDDELHETELVENWRPEGRPEIDESDTAPALGEYYNSESEGARFDYDNGEKKPAQDGGNKNVIVELVNSDYVLWYKQATNNESYLTYNFAPGKQPEESSADNSVGIVEFDLKMGNVNTNIPTRLGIWCGGVEAEVRIIARDGYLMLGDKSGKAFQGSPKLNPDEWYNIRLEYYYKLATLSPASAKIKVYVDNEYITDINVTNVNNRAGKSDRVNIYLHKLEEAAYMCLDNLYLGYVDKAYVEPAIPEADENNANGAYFTGKLESVAGEKKDFNDSRGITKTDGLAAGAVGEYVGYHYRINAESATRDGYVYVTYPTLSGTPGYVTSIFEADIRLDGIGTEGKFGKITLCNSGKEIEITLWISEGKVYFGNAAGTPLEGLEQLEAGKWYNIRITAHYYQFTVDSASNVGVYVSVNGSEDVEIKGANCLDRTSKNWSDRAFLYLSGKQPEASFSIDNLFLGYARINPEQCVHTDAEFDTLCDRCGATYYTAATCPGHVDADSDTECDKCGSDYYTEATCPGHVDINSDTKCDKCGATYYTAATCPGHVDTDSDTKCDVCDSDYYTEATCPGHVDTDLDAECDKCKTTYYTESTCPGHVDEEGDDGRCDICGKEMATEPPAAPEWSDDGSGAVTGDLYGGNSDPDAWQEVIPD